MLRKSSNAAPDETTPLIINKQENAEANEDEKNELTLKDAYLSGVLFGATCGLPVGFIATMIGISVDLYKNHHFSAMDAMIEGAIKGVVGGTAIGIPSGFLLGGIAGIVSYCSIRTPSVSTSNSSLFGAPPIDDPEAPETMNEPMIRLNH